MRSRIERNNRDGYMVVLINFECAILILVEISIPQRDSEKAEKYKNCVFIILKDLHSVTKHGNAWIPVIFRGISMMKINRFFPN